jgi:uncharacterized protein (DUF58 family)
MVEPGSLYKRGVEPALDELIALRARVQAWPPPLRSAERGSGAATSPLRGRGVDYAESRLYAQGDDARHIDWRVTARTGRMHTKVFHAERDRVTLLVADTAPTLYFGTRGCFKSVQAARVGALAAWAAQRSGDRISALRSSHGEAPRPPAGGARGALRALDALVRWYAARPADDVGLDHALQAAGRVTKPGARILALLDPRSVESVSDARLTALAAHHDAIAVLLVDPLELVPPQERVAFAADAVQVELDLGEPATRVRWQHAFAERFAAARTRLQRLGWRAIALATGEAPDRVLDALLPRRREVA